MAILQLTFLASFPFFCSLLFINLDLIEGAPEVATTNPLAERLKQGAGKAFNG